MTTTDAEPISDDEIRVVVDRLSRPNRSGGRVIERAAIMAEGTSSGAILDWLATAAWAPEALPDATPQSGGSGLHGMRRESARGGARPPAPRRYVSPSTTAA
ncbi:MAG TPA: hypothetical protein VI318_21455 [Baekduia sp.]